MKIKEELKLNKDLTINEEYKKVITEADSGRYSYFDFTKEKLQEIALKDLKDLKYNDAATLVQALYPQYLICSGLFDCFLMFEIKKGVRVDPPKYYYGDLQSYLNNDKKTKFNYLAAEIIDLFKNNNIEYNQDWHKLLPNNEVTQ
jgi:hypothetical protein